jgi:ribosomal protein S2
MSAKLNVNTNDTQHMSVMGKRKSKKHSILLVGDSQVGGCSVRAKNKLNDTFYVTGLVKPGTVINTLTSTVKGGKENLTDNDVLVFLGWYQ